MNKKYVTLIACLAAGLLVWLEQAFGLKWSLMALIGLLLGFTLSFSGFGIVFGWREMISKGNSYYVRTHLITIFIEIVLFTLCLSFSHALFGGKMTGNIMPVGIPFIVGAFLFGCGMQLAGVCASGTLYCCGEARPRFWLVLVFYGIGTLIGKSYQQAINGMFHSQVILMKDFTGSLWSGALLNLGLVLLLFLVFTGIEFKRSGQVKPLLRGENLFWRDGRFTVLTGGIIIALLNSCIVALHGSAWTITGAIYDMSLRFASWFGFFSDNPKLASPLFSNPMVGMFWAGVLGAALSKSILNKPNDNKMTLKVMIASVLGGLLMGIGAMYAACNLGGFFDGTASGSLHGWIWMLVALFGSVLGIQLRKFFYA